MVRESVEWAPTIAEGSARKLGEGSWRLNACPMDGGRIVTLGGGDFGAVRQRAAEAFIRRAEGAEMSLGKGKQPVAIHADGGAFVRRAEPRHLIPFRPNRAPPN